MWTIRTNQNESELSHYGVKGMRWGVRKEQDRVGKAVKTKTVRSLYRKNQSLAKGDGPVTIRKVSKEYKQDVAYNSQKNSSMLTSSKSTRQTSSRKASSEYETELAYNSGGGGSASGTSPSDLTEEEIRKLLEEGKISKEYAEELLANTGRGQDSNTTTTPVTPKGSKEYQEELAANSQKNAFQSDVKKVKKTKVSDLTTKKSWQQKIAEGAKAVSKSIEKIGKQAVDAAKNVISAGKEAISKFFNVKSTSKTMSLSEMSDKDKAKVYNRYLDTRNRR